MIWPLFRFFGQKFVKFFVVFLENLRHQKDILKLTDLYKGQTFIFSRLFVLNPMKCEWKQCKISMMKFHFKIEENPKKKGHPFSLDFFYFNCLFTLETIVAKPVDQTQPCTNGVKYFLKSHSLMEDKIPQVSTKV